ncbi:MAG: hypothetical protein KAI66_06035 [Lentisphaeria bacterium]|nr:hypothetical protein [Lentisphaeria bacterium]
MDMDTLAKLAPFALRSRAVVVGRQRMCQIRNKLAFVLVTTDITDNSQREILQAHKCPVYQALTSADIERLFEFHNTKVLGFLRNPVSMSMQKEFKGMCIQTAKTRGKPDLAQDKRMEKEE